MNLKRFAPGLILAVVLGPAVFAAEDVTGKWSGTLVSTVDDGQVKNDTAYLVLKQTAMTVTGTAGQTENSAERMNIANGKVETLKKEGKDVTTVTFTLKDQHDTDAPAVTFVLSLMDGHLKGKALAEFEGHTVTFVLDVTRVKK